MIVQISSRLQKLEAERALIVGDDDDDDEEEEKIAVKPLVKHSSDHVVLPSTTPTTPVLHTPHPRLLYHHVMFSGSTVVHLCVGEVRGGTAGSRANVQARHGEYYI